MYYADWKKPENYDYTKKHHLRLWAWEFLRRNPDYSAYWQETLVEHRRILAYLIQNNLETNKLKFSNMLGLLTTKHSEKPNEFLSYNPDIPVNRDFDPEDSPFFYIIRYSASEKWGHIFICDPANNIPLMFRKEFGHKIYRPGDENIFYIGENEAAVKITLTKPISPQLTKYRQTLLQTQKEGKHRVINTKVKEQALIDYLRVLDAHAEGYRAEKAAEIIFPRKNNRLEHYRNCLKRAKKISKKDYVRWL